MKKQIIQALIVVVVLILSLATAQAARLPTVGADSNAWGTVLNEYLLVSHTENGALKNFYLNGSNITFEGTTNDDFQLILEIGNPTADRTITFPDLSGEVTLLGQVINNAEVDDDLTISGGIIDDSVIGGTTPAAGNFTNVEISAEGPTLRLTEELGGSEGSWDIYAGGVGGNPNFEIENINLGASAIFIKGSDNFIGIGTDTPSEKLDVDGNIRTATGNIILDSSTSELKIADADGSGNYGRFDVDGLPDGDVVYTFPNIEGTVVVADINNAVNGLTIDNAIIGQDTAASGTFTTLNADDLSISNSVSLPTDSIESGEITDDTITDSDVSDDSLTATSLATDSVASDEIATDAVGSDEIATDAVDSDEITDGTITTADIADNTVTSAKLADNAVNNSKIADNSINNSMIQTDAVTASKIAANAVGASEIGSGVVSSDEIAANAVAMADLARGTNGQIIVANTGADSAYVSVSGDATLAANGALTIAADSVALGTDTTGNYVTSLTAGSGVSVGAAGESATPTVALAPLTANWDQTGAFDIVLNNAGSELKILESAGGTFFGLVDVGDLSADRTYTFPNVDGTVVTTGDTGSVTNTMLAGSIAASKLVGTDIATVGTITAGTWEGTTIAVAKGGTGATTSTGSGSVVLATSPTLVTPTLGVASATSINKLTITTPATGSTLTIADGKTLTASNTLTFTGTDSSSVAFGAGGTVAYVADKLSVFAATTSAELAGVISDETGSGALVFANTPTLVTPALGAATATSIAIGASGTAITKHLSATGTVDFAAITKPNCDTKTVTVTGAATGDTVILGPPSTIEAGISSWSGFVSAADTVTIKACAVATDTDAASATWRVDVWQH